MCGDSPSVSHDQAALLQAAEMVSDLKAAFHGLLTENQWMDATTRHAAMQKANAILVLQGFPSWCDSSAQVDEFYNKVRVVFRVRETSRIPHCLDSRLTVNCEILATCKNSNRPLLTSQHPHTESIN
jgi:hypothetical protein